MKKETHSSKDTKTNKDTKKKSFPIVAIGASAGGLEAVTTLLKELPPDTGMAYVYIQHLDPTYKSKLSEILSRHTKMKVLEAKNRLPIKVDHLYIIPPNKSMALIDGVIALKAREAKPSPHMPIDKFFRSLAEKHQYAPIGVVLSGNASDGTLGLKSIKMVGGITMVQDQTAKFQSMPKSAIAEGVVDLVLPPDKIAHELSRISSNKDFIRKVFVHDEEPKEIHKEEISTILDLLKKAIGIDFNNYKINTIQRRIIRRMVLHKLETLNEYIKYIHQHTSEIHALHHDLLINVTSFFRDADGLEFLQKSILPKILKSKRKNEPLRVWVPACATGEEAYSLAIMLNELTDQENSDQMIQIFATDLSETAIAKARIGLYSKADMEGVSEKRLSKFFTRVDSSYRVIKSIRDICVFAPHNIFRDPPFSRIDLISCCNLMIYLENSLQKKLLHLLHYSLNPDGYLILGKSETVAPAGELFVQMEKRFKIFSKRKDIPNQTKFELRFPTREPRGDLKQIVQKPVPVKENRLEKAVDAMLLNRFVPASVLVNEDMDILQFRGSTGLFLEPAPGKASLNLLKMARAGLAFELKNTIHKCAKSHTTVKKSGIEIKHKGQLHNISIEVVPVKYNGEDDIFLVVFQEELLPPTLQRRAEGKQQQVVKQLKEEIISLKEDMRSMIEEREAHVEELQSANEEIISSNEELQSINEELETSKEEVESTNEELATINAELQTRNDQLSEAYAYSSVIFDIIGEAVLVLGRDFRVKAANKSFYTIFRVTEEETEGKLIYELGNRQWDISQLRQALEGILDRGSPIKKFQIEHDFPKIGRKIMIINAQAVIQRSSHQHLILVAIEDITEHKQKEQLLEEREIWFRNMANQAPVMIWVSGSDRRKNFFNDTWLHYTGKKNTDEEGIGWRKRIHIDDVHRYLEVFNNSYETHKAFVQEYRLQRADGEYRWVLEIAKPIITENSFSGFIGSCTEIHEKKILNEELEQLVNERTVALKEMNQELERSNVELQQFAYVASHDLQEPLRKNLIYADRLLNIKAELPPSAGAFIDKIISSSERMRSLIEELLEFSRISKGNKFELTNLEDLIQKLLSDFEIIINEKKATITFEKLPYIKAVPIQMEQLFHNLISNALKFSKKDEPPEIRISTREPEQNYIINAGLDPTRRYVEIIVADKGIGFSENYKEKIFEIFHRLNSKQDYPGTGIGLALCRKIVNNHGGKIFAESNEMVGTAFHIILPFIQVEDLTSEK